MTTIRNEENHPSDNADEKTLVAVRRRKKVCTVCGRKLYIGQFYRRKLKNGGFYYFPKCNDCESRRRRDRYLREKEAKKAKMGIFIDKRSGKPYQYNGHSRCLYWSPSMVRTLQTLYSYTKNEELSVILGVSKNTIYKKSRELGLTKSHGFIHSVIMENQRKATFNSAYIRRKRARNMNAEGGEAS